jgi:hypothetical protein
MNTRESHQTILNRAHGRTALARRLSLPQRTPRRVHRSWFLAAAIAARYALLERRWPALALVYRQRDEHGATIQQTSVVTHSSIFVSPRLLLSMLVTPRQKVRHVAGESVRAWATGSDGVPRTLVLSPKREQAARPQREVIERIVRRTVREERVGMATGLSAVSSSARTAEPARGANPPVPSPLLGIVHRRNPRTNEEWPAVREQAQAELQRPAITTVPNAPAAVHSQAEITRITDQVLQTLDRRIVAQRERMGRI